jgi:hypothetical protein
MAKLTKSAGGNAVGHDWLINRCALQVNPLNLIDSWF